MSHRVAVAALLLAVFAAACTGDGSADSTTSSTSLTTAPSITTTTRVAPPIDVLDDIVLEQNGPVFIASTDRGAFVAALQYLLVCTGYDRPTPGSPDMIVDGIYGPITSRAVSYAQASLRRVPTGEVDEETFAELSRRCEAVRELDFTDGPTSVAGNVTPGDADEFAVALNADQRVTVTVQVGAVDIVIESVGGETLKSADDPAPWSGVAEADDAYRIRVVSAEGPQSYELTIDIPEAPAVTIDFGPMRLRPDGVGIARFGESAEDTIEVLSFVLGPPDDDTGWEVGRAGGRVCEGTNRELRWTVQGGSGGPTALFTAAFTDVGGAQTFAQYAYSTTAANAVDPGAQSLSTNEFITIGSSFEQFVAAYGEPNIFNQELGLTGFNDGMVAGLLAVESPQDEAAEETDDATDAPVFVWYLAAGEDGCLDFR